MVAMGSGDWRGCRTRPRASHAGDGACGQGPWRALWSGMLDVVAEPHRIGRELQALVRRLGGVAVPRVALGRQGGRTEVTVRWRRDDGLWWHFAKGEDRYALGFGVTPLDPLPPLVALTPKVF